MLARCKLQDSTPALRAHIGSVLAGKDSQGNGPVSRSSDFLFGQVSVVGQFELRLPTQGGPTTDTASRLALAQTPPGLPGLQADFGHGFRKAQPPIGLGRMEFLLYGAVPIRQRTKQDFATRYHANLEPLRASIPPAPPGRLRPPPQDAPSRSPAPRERGAEIILRQPLA